MKKELAFEKSYLTVADVKSYLCISTSAAYELTHRKDFPVCRLGSSIRIPTQLFLAWVDKHTRVPADLAPAQKEVTVHVGETRQGKRFCASASQRELAEPNHGWLHR